MANSLTQNRCHIYRLVELIGSGIPLGGASRLHLKWVDLDGAGNLTNIQSHGPEYIEFEFRAPQGGIRHAFF